MKIVRLTAENVKRIKAVEIVPDAAGNLVVISGRNDQGKSSVLDAMWYALGGKDASPALPIRRGAKKAKVELDLGDLIVTRTWTADNSYLTVTGKDGEKKQSPQALLDSLVGRLALDPIAFSRLSPAEQRRIVLDLAGLKDKLTEAKAARARAEEERRDAGREVRTLEAQAAENPVPAEPVPAPPDATALAQEVARLEQERDAMTRTRDEYERAGERQQALMAQVMELQAQVRVNNTARTALEEHLKTFSFRQEQLDEARNTLASVGAAQAAYDRAAAAVKIDGALSSAKKAHARAEQFITDIDDTVELMFLNAPLPVKGLTVSDDGVLYGGVPFPQLSSSLQIKVSMAMAMALNPELRVIRILEGSLLDDASLKLVTELAAAKDFQVWMEVVTGRGPSGVVIEDGMVVEPEAEA